MFISKTRYGEHSMSTALSDFVPTYQYLFTHEGSLDFVKRNDLSSEPKTKKKKMGKMWKRDFYAFSSMGF